MNVAGGGIGSFIFGMIFILGLTPLLITVLLNLLGFYSGLKKANKIISLIASFILLFGLQVLFLFLLRDIFAETIFFFAIYLLPLVILTFCFGEYVKQYLKMARLTVVCITILVLSIICLKVKHDQPVHNKNFEAQMVNELGLKLIATDSLYSTNNILIDKDTLAGFYKPFRSALFIQSLQNIQYCKKLYSLPENLNVSKLSYANGAFYTNSTSNKYLARIIYTNDIPDKDSLFKNDSLFSPVTKRLAYKDKVVICGNNDKSYMDNVGSQYAIFNIKTQKLLYHTYGLNSTLIGNRLLTVDTSNKRIVLKCLDLNEMRISWATQIDDKYITCNNIFCAEPGNNELVYKGNMVTLSTDRAIYLLDLQSGKK